MKRYDLCTIHFCIFNRYVRCSTGGCINQGYLKICASQMSSTSAWSSENSAGRLHSDWSYKRTCHPWYVMKYIQNGPVDPVRLVFSSWKYYILNILSVVYMRHSMMFDWRIFSSECASRTSLTGAFRIFCGWWCIKIKVVYAPSKFGFQVLGSRRGSTERAW